MRVAADISAARATLPSNSAYVVQLPGLNDAVAFVREADERQQHAALPAIWCGAVRSQAARRSSAVVDQRMRPVTGRAPLREGAAS